MNIERIRRGVNLSDFAAARLRAWNHCAPRWLRAPRCLRRVDSRVGPPGPRRFCPI